MRIRYSRLSSYCALSLSAAIACHAAPLRPPRASLTPPARELRLTRDLSLVGIHWIIEIREGVGGRPATGGMRATTGDGNRRGVEREFGCETRATDQDWGPWACTVPFLRGAPDWAAALARLDALGIMAPPRDVPPPDRERGRLPVCKDGTPWSLEVRVGGVPAVRDGQRCRPSSPHRAAFEAGVDSVLDAVVAAASAP